MGRIWAIFVGFNGQACQNREHYYDGPPKVRQNFLSNFNVPDIFKEFFRKPRQHVRYVKIRQKALTEKCYIQTIHCLNPSFG